MRCRLPRRPVTVTPRSARAIPPNSEDSFPSRQLASHPDTDATFLVEFAGRAATSDEPGSALYATGVQHKVRTQAVRPIFTSMVTLSDTGDLPRRYLQLTMPRAFVHGDHNSRPSYLPELTADGVDAIAITGSGH